MGSQKMLPTKHLLCFVFWSVTFVLTTTLTSAFTSHPIANVASVLQSKQHNDARYPFRIVPSSSNSNEDWGFDDVEEDPRVQAMRSMLESSWDGASMGVVPSSADKAAEAAAECAALAMGQQHNILMIDLRLPSYDITEGSKLYDPMAVYNFCACLSDQLRERKLIRKSLVLVRNDEERKDIERALSRRNKETISNVDEVTEDVEEEELEGSGDTGDEVDEFRKKLMSSWDSSNNEEEDNTTIVSGAKKQSTPHSNTDNQSHRLWSIVGSEEISNGSDMFEQVIAAVDQNARLVVDGPSPEDALILISPYDTADLIGVRRILARYGSTRTIIIVNSRMETLPAELNSAVMVYGIMPLAAKSRSGREDYNEAGLKVVVMKRFPNDWSLHIDVYGDGFVEADASGAGTSVADSSKEFPSPEWIAMKVQSHVEGLRD